VDYSGQELRLQAGLSGDKEMLSCYIGDNLRDIHSITASSAMKVVWSSTVYDGLMELVDGNLEEYERFLALLHSGDKWVASTAKNLRNLAKGVNFGSSYGCEAPKMQEILITDLLTATVMLEAKLKKFSGYEEWKERVEAEAKERGYVTTLLGGRRHLQTAMTSDDKWLQGSAARQASNFMIQSAGAELCKKTLGRLWDSGIFFRLDAVFIAVIHDEVVWSVMPEDAFESIQVVWDAVSQPYTPDFPVPFLGSISLGPTFGQQIEVGEKPDRAAVQKVLDSLVAKIPATV
jgi:DNA polymerase I-like protein with 3'-5' exonuclease and polymerase domains